ncbi:MAG: NAD-dependent epimerase/dehydratase family protein [Burkholderiales bacterium]|nr:NAD-dependent epimerase/dehydratase family protein [Burkholderiales bacterium]
MSSTSSTGQVLVLGARSHVGDFLLPALVQAGHAVFAVSRQQSGLSRSEGVVWLHAGADGGIHGHPALQRPAVVSLLPAPLLAGCLESLIRLDITRVIAFSSTSVFTKARSMDPAEVRLVESLMKAESTIVSLCSKHQVAWTLFRPTLVYSWGRDRNVTEIGNFVRRFRVFLLLGRGNGLRQPVHAEDLARACVAALDNDKTFGKAYNLAGATRLTYRSMVEEVFRCEGLPPRFISVPGWAIRAAIRAARIVPRLRELSPELATRMEMDMCFDSSDALRDFGFEPRAFALPLP